MKQFKITPELKKLHDEYKSQGFLVQYDIDGIHIYKSDESGPQSSTLRFIPIKTKKSGNGK